MTTAPLERTAAATIEHRAKKALSKVPPYPAAEVIEFSDPTWDQEIAISPGTVFVKQDTPVPKSAGLRLKRVGHWNLIAGFDGFETAKRLGERGWYLSFVVPAVQALGFAFNLQVALRKALHRLMQKVEVRNFNALEIANIRVRTFLGISWARVAGYPRHLRDNPFVRDLNPYRHRSYQSRRGGIHKVVNRHRSQGKTM